MRKRQGGKEGSLEASRVSARVLWRHAYCSPLCKAASCFGHAKCTSRRGRAQVARRCSGAVVVVAMCVCMLSTEREGGMECCLGCVAMKSIREERGAARQLPRAAGDGGGYGPQGDVVDCFLPFPPLLLR